MANDPDLDTQIDAIGTRFAREVARLVFVHMGKAMLSPFEALRTQVAPPVDPMPAVVKQAKAKAKAKAKPSPKVIRRDPEQLASVTAALAAYIVDHPGQRIEQIAAGMKTTTAALQRPMDRLRRAKTVRAVGKLRATSYWPANNTPTPDRGMPKQSKKAGRRNNRRGKTGRV